jgi:hypothetical protein
MLTIILELIAEGLKIANSQLNPESAASNAIENIESLESIIAKAMAAYEMQAGKPIDISLIKPYVPIP